MAGDTEEAEEPRSMYTATKKDFFKINFSRFLRIFNKNFVCG